MTTTLEVEKRLLQVPIVGGEVALYVPVEIEEKTLNKEIAVQDLVRKRLLDIVRRLEKIIGSNMELFLCQEQKLQLITGEFLSICGDLRKFMEDFSTFTSSIPELEEAREDVRAFLFSHVMTAIGEVDGLQEEIFEDTVQGRHPEKLRLAAFRKKLAKAAGVVRTELQKIFAHLFARDPRNLFREAPRSQHEILRLQFKRDVAMTETLYGGVRSLDRYMRGAILPSDLLQMTAERIDRERTVSCLFEPDYSLFLNALLEEILERLVPEVRGVLELDGIWYDDFESIQNKVNSLYETCITFKVFYTERSELREKVRTRKAVYDKVFDRRALDMVGAMLDVFETHKYRAVAESVRTIDQILVDLEGTLLQWEKGIARRAFARQEWRDDEPFRRRGERSVTFR